RVEALREPAVDGSEQFASLLRLTLVAPEPRHAHRSAEFPGFGLLLAGDSECALEYPSAFVASGSGAFSVTSPATRLISASNHLSPLASIAVIASSMHRQASSNWPRPARAAA